MWVRITFGKRDLKVFCTKIWNSLPRHITSPRILSTFLCIFLICGMWHILFHFYILSRKFYIRRNNNIDSTEVGHIVITHLLPWNDQGNCSYITIFQLRTMKYYHHYLICQHSFTFSLICRSGCRTIATSRMEHFVIIVNGWKPLTIITISSILDVAAVLDPPLTWTSY